MAINYPTSLDNFGNPAGTTLLADPSYLHNQQHDDINDASKALQTKLGVGAGTAKQDYLLVGQGNGTSIWGTVWNGGSITNANLTGATITTGTIGTAVGIANAGMRIYRKIVGSASADYITDGTADDVQIQAAIDAVSAAGGGVVFLQAGTYNVLAHAIPADMLPTSVTNSCIVVKNGVTVQGEGVDVTNVVLSAFSGTVNQPDTVFSNEHIDTDFNLGIKDMTITAPNWSTTSNVWAGAILFRGASTITLENLHLKYGGFWITGGGTAQCFYDGTAFHSNCHTIYINHVDADGYLGSNSISYARDYRVENCTFKDFHDDGLITVGASWNGVFSNNLWDNYNPTIGTAGNANGCLYLLTDASLGTWGYNQNLTKNIHIVHNTFRYLSLEHGTGENGVALAHVSDVFIDGNKMEYNHGAGIANLGGNNTYNTQITNNIIHHNIGGGIIFTAGGANDNIFALNIQNNQVYDNGSSGTQKNGIQVNAGTAVNVNISNNSVWDDQGTTTQANQIVTQPGTATYGVFSNNLTYGGGSLGVISNYATSVHTGNLGGW